MQAGWLALSAHATNLVTQKQGHEVERERKRWCGYKFSYKNGYRYWYRYRSRCGYKCGYRCGREGKSVYLSARCDVVHQMWQGRSDGRIMLLKSLAHTLQGVDLRL